MSCQQRRIQIVARLDNSLEAAEELGLVRHLDACDPCSRFHAEQCALQSLLVEGAPELEPPARLWIRIQNQIDLVHPAVEAETRPAWLDWLALPAWKPAWAALGLMLVLSLPLFTLQESVDSAALAELNAFHIDAKENPFLSEVIAPVDGNPFENLGGLK